MSADPSLVLLAGVIAALRTSPAVAAAFAAEGAAVAVYDEAPQDAALPLIEVVDVTTVGEEVVETDGGQVDEVEAVVTVHVWSARRGALGGKPEAVRIAKAVRSALATELPLEPDDDGQRFRVVVCAQAESRHSSGADDEAAQSVVTVRYLVEPSEV